MKFPIKILEGNDNHWIISSTSIPFDAPWCYFYKKTYCHLIDEIHQWMNNNNIEYNIEYDIDYNVWFILFKNEKDAVLFKLTWG